VNVDNKRKKREGSGHIQGDRIGQQLGRGFDQRGVEKNLVLMWRRRSKIMLIKRGRIGAGKIGGRTR